VDSSHVDIIGRSSNRRQHETDHHHHRAAAAAHRMGATHPVEQQQPASNCRSKHTPDRHHRDRAGAAPAAHPQTGERDLSLRVGFVRLVLREAMSPPEMSDAEVRRRMAREVLEGTKDPARKRAADWVGPGHQDHPHRDADVAGGARSARTPRPNTPLLTVCKPYSLTLRMPAKSGPAFQPSSSRGRGQFSTLPLRLPESSPGKPGPPPTRS
jgi:hypothetical protein